VEVRPGAGGGSGRHDEIRRGRKIGLKQELVASSACDIGARWKVPTRGPFACATGCYQDIL
jgi:hypothetical protein